MHSILKTVTLNFYLEPMKRILTLSIIAVVLSVVFAACASSKSGGHCDAYGSVNTIENNDVASK